MARERSSESSPLTQSLHMTVSVRGMVLLFLGFVVNKDRGSLLARAREAMLFCWLHSQFSQSRMNGSKTRKRIINLNAEETREQEV